MNVTITPGPLSGTITPPPSKSQAHRVLIAAALATGESVIRNFRWSEDTRATAGCLTALGAAFRSRDGDILELEGLCPSQSLPLLDCGESGSTLRFLIPVVLATAGGGVFTGRGRLMERPLAPYFGIFREEGISFSQNHDILQVQGTLTPGTYRLPGNVSSQFITGLLHALPLLAGDSRILLTSELESAGYVDMTLETLRRFGVTVEPEETGWFIPGNQRYQPRDVTLEGDWSQAAFFLAAAGLGNPLNLRGMDGNSAQGDRIMAEYVEILASAGEVSLDVSGCPDLVPPLAVRAALRSGETTRLVNAARLRLKESDRLASVATVLGALGADVTEERDSLTIRGREILPGGVTVDSWNDHRIAMMAAVAATRCQRPVTVTGAECVKKSYPEFWTDYEALGGRIEVRE